VLFVKHNAAKDPTKEKLPCQSQPKETSDALCFTGPCIDFRRVFHCGQVALIAIDPPKADTVFGPFHQGKGQEMLVVKPNRLIFRHATSHLPFTIKKS
jgi:hypothetical protein